jgi:hypothetical protein
VGSISQTETFDLNLDNALFLGQVSVLLTDYAVRFKMNRIYKLVVYTLQWVDDGYRLSLDGGQHGLYKTGLLMHTGERKH